MKTHKWAEIEAKMSSERRKRIEERARKIIAEMPLEELRAARHLTQVQLAETMGLSQASISKLERRTDMYISTLKHFVEAMGGNLDIRAVFPDGEVKINQFNELPTSAAR